MDLDSVVIRYGADITDFEAKTQNMLASLTRGAAVAEAKAKAIENSFAATAAKGGAAMASLGAAVEGMSRKIPSMTMEVSGVVVAGAAVQQTFQAIERQAAATAASVQASVASMTAAVVNAQRLLSDVRYRTAGLQTLRVAEMRELLVGLGAPTTGRRADLLASLEGALISRLERDISAATRSLAGGAPPALPPVIPIARPPSAGPSGGGAFVEIATAAAQAAPAIGQLTHSIENLTIAARRFQEVSHSFLEPQRALMRGPLPPLMLGSGPSGRAIPLGWSDPIPIALGAGAKHPFTIGESIRAAQDAAQAFSERLASKIAIAEEYIDDALMAIGEISPAGPRTSLSTGIFKMPPSYVAGQISHPAQVARDELSTARMEAFQGNLAPVQAAMGVAIREIQALHKQTLSKGMLGQLRAGVSGTLWDQGGLGIDEITEIVGTSALRALDATEAAYRDLGKQIGFMPLPADSAPRFARRLSSYEAAEARQASIQAIEASRAAYGHLFMSPADKAALAFRESVGIAGQLALTGRPSMLALPPGPLSRAIPLGWSDPTAIPVGPRRFPMPLPIADIVEVMERYKQVIQARIDQEMRNLRVAELTPAFTREGAYRMAGGRSFSTPMVGTNIMFPGSQVALPGLQLPMTMEDQNAIRQSMIAAERRILEQMSFARDAMQRATFPGIAADRMRFGPEFQGATLDMARIRAGMSGGILPPHLAVTIRPTTDFHEARAQFIQLKAIFGEGFRIPIRFEMPQGMLPPGRGPGGPGQIFLPGVGWVGAGGGGGRAGALVVQGGGPLAPLPGQFESFAMLPPEGRTGGVIVTDEGFVRMTRGGGFGRRAGVAPGVGLPTAGGMSEVEARLLRERLRTGEPIPSFERGRGFPGPTIHGMSEAEAQLSRRIMGLEGHQLSRGPSIPVVQPFGGLGGTEEQRRAFFRAMQPGLFMGGGGGGGGGGPPPPPPPPGGGGWNWQTSAIGGLAGSFLPGRFTGIGGALGGGFGPVGMVAGIGVGLGLSAIVGTLETIINLATKAATTLVDFGIQGAKHIAILGMEFEKMEVAFRVMTGSQERGSRILGEIQELAIQTPYTTRQLVEQGRVLLGFGVEPEALKPALARLGDIAGGDEERLRRLSLAFGQVISAGRLMGQERRQFAEAGVGLKDFADTIGVTSSEFLAMSLRGEVGADVMVKTINRLTNEGGRFFGLAEEGLKRTFGRWNALVETIELGAMKIGKAVFEKIGTASFLKDITTNIQQFAEQRTPAFMEWLERARPSFVELGSIVQDVASRFDSWLGSMGGPTWESVHERLESFHRDSLPKIASWLEIMAEGAGRLATAFDLAFGKITTEKLDILTRIPGTNIGPFREAADREAAEKAAKFEVDTLESKLRYFRDTPEGAAALAGLEGGERIEELQARLDRNRQKRTVLGVAERFVPGFLADMDFEEERKRLNLERASIMEQIGRAQKAGTPEEFIGQLEKELKNARGKLDAIREQYFGIKPPEESIAGGFLGMGSAVATALRRQKELESFVGPPMPGWMRDRDPRAQIKVPSVSEDTGRELAARAEERRRIQDAMTGPTAMFEAGLRDVEKMFPPSRLPGGVGGAIGIGISTMLASRGLDTDREARQFARQQQFEKSWDKIAKDSDRTTSAADKFQQRMELIDQATFDPRKLGGMFDVLGEQFAPSITGEQAAAASLEAFQELEKAVGMEKDVGLTPAMLAGSQEAQDTINRSMQNQVDTQQRIEKVLEEGNKQRKEQLDRAKKFYDDFMRLNKGKGKIVGKSV